MMMKKWISVLLALMLCLCLAVSVSAASDSDIYDEADLLSSAEEAQLSGKLADIGSRYNAQIVIMTLASTNGRNIDTLLEELYDGMEMGYGENRDGVFLLVCMDVREYRILSNGFAGVAINSSDIDYIGDTFVSDLSAGNYAAAFNGFADQCAYYLDGYINGFPFNPGEKLLICLIIGLVAGLIVVFSMKGQLKTVRRQNRANVYVKSGSMQLTVCRDLFLYRNVTRTRKETSSSSGSRSSRSTGGGSF